MIVAALLLQTPLIKIEFDAFFASVGSIYSYLVKRGGVKMILRQSPSKLSVIDTIRKLGFRVQEILNQQGKRMVKNYTIYTDAKTD